jgi:glycine cleavage system H protein
LLNHSESFGSVESVKAASDVYSPVAGEIVETNTVLCDVNRFYDSRSSIHPLFPLQQLEGSPVLVNQSPFKDGWFMKIKVSISSSYSPQYACT